MLVASPVMPCQRCHHLDERLLHQVNDSYIIFKTLAPLVFGRAVSEAEAGQIKAVSFEGKYPTLLRPPAVPLEVLTFVA